MVRRSNLNLTNSVVATVLSILAVGLAVALVWLGQSGGLDMAIFVSVAVVGTVAALYSLDLGLMALIFVAAVDGFLKGFSPGWHTQLLKDYLLAICLLRWAWLSVLGYQRKSARSPLALPVIIFGSWVAVQFFNHRSGSILMGLAGLRMWTVWLPLYFIAYDALRTRRQIEQLTLFLVFLLTPVAIYGIVQYVIGLDHLFDLAPGFSVYSHARYAGAEGAEWRPPSTMVSPHALAGTLTMVTLLAVGMVGYVKRNRILQVAILVAVPVMGMAILITAVRNAAASAAAGGIALLVIIRRFDLAIILAIVGVIAVFQVDAMTGGEALKRIRSVVDNPEYTARRVMTPWRTGVWYALQRPLGSGIASGAGLGRTARSQGLSAWGLDPEERIVWVENEYGRALLELGIPGFLLFIWMLYAVMRNNFVAYRAATQERDKWLLAGTFGAAVSMLARLLVGSALYGPAGPIFWYFAAIAARIPEIESEETLRQQSLSTETRVTELGVAELPWMRGGGGS